MKTNLWTRAPGPTPTDQQKALIKSAQGGGDIACIAVAGAGKTATGILAAEALKGAGCMVMFNRSARDDAFGRAAPNTTVTTSHGLAFQEVIDPSPGYQKKLAGTLDPKEGPRLTGSVVSELLELDSSGDEAFNDHRQLAQVILKTIEAFQISADDQPDSRHVPIASLPLALRRPDNRDASDAACQRIAEHAKRLWHLMASERSRVPINHDSYLKILQLRRPRLTFDFWVMDEYQDTTPVLADLIDKQDGQMLAIGDPYQAIYGWRGAINAFDPMLERGVPVHYLTDSFRYNHQIAGLATLILRSLGEIHPVRGQARDQINPVEGDGLTVICRTNLTILLRAGELLLAGKPVYVDGGLSPAAHHRVTSALALFEGRREDIRIPMLQAMGSWSDLKAHADALGESASDLRRLIRMVEDYQTQLPHLLTALERKLPHKNPKLPGQTTLITAHRAKGRQFAHVELDSDLAIPPHTLSSLLAAAPLTAQERESIHLLYVAITRSELSIQLPTAIKQNFAGLHQAFAWEADTPTTFVADTQVALPQQHERAHRRARTEAFIRQHGRK